MGRKYTLADYYEGLFEHRRKVQELYNTPLIGWKAFAVIVVLLAVAAYLGMHRHSWGRPRSIIPPKVAPDYLPAISEA